MPSARGTLVRQQCPPYTRHSQLHRAHQGRCHQRTRSMPTVQQLGMPEQGSTAGNSVSSAAVQQQAGVTVRPLRAEDKERWLELFRDYITWYQATVSDEVIEQTWQNLMTGGIGNHRGLVAEEGSSSKVVGLAHILFHKSTWSKTHYCYLEDLYVDQQVRAQGIGRALIEAVYRLADGLGATKTYWQTHERNYRARGLYDQMGKKSEFILYERT
eukprot:GHUV01003705.1.p1 GENE.GHUV01003705.1~~GHUV01003705.1.p1  ORF type:complete len:214 (+),score=35.06 GHUV01003705.1:77-718(+)